MLDYEKQYHDYFHHYLIDDEQHYLLRSRLSFDNYFEQGDKYKKVFEYGVGLGQNIFLMENKFGFDISKFALEFSTKKGIQTYSSLDEIPEESFDIIIFCHVLEHLTNPTETLKLIKTKLKLGGKLVIVIPKEIHKKARYEMSKDQHLFAWNFRIINNLLIHCGFKVLENKQYAGTGFHKLRHLAKISYMFWKLATSLFGNMLNRKELVIVAKNE